MGKLCKYCNAQFESAHVRKIFCSKLCSRRDYGKRRNLTERSNNVMRWKKRTKQRAIEYKGGKCVICGYNKCPRALKFHHVQANRKDFGISGVSKAWNKIKTELDKCILVCGNCHDEIHEGLIDISGIDMLQSFCDTDRGLQ